MDHGNEAQTGRTFRMLLELALAMSKDTDRTSFVVVACTDVQAHIYANQLAHIMAAKGIEMQYSEGVWATPWGPTLTS